MVEVDALTDRETFPFQEFGVDEVLECAITPGMPSFIYTRPERRDFAEKTIRWPGHYAAVDVLRECGVLDLAPVDVDGTPLAAREFMARVLSPRLRPRPGEGDVCVMWNTVQGTKAGRPARGDYCLWEEAGPVTGISAMARVTGFAAGSWSGRSSQVRRRRDCV